MSPPRPRPSSMFGAQIQSSRRRTSRSPSATRRTSASISAIVSSAVACVSTSGVFETTTPRRVHAGTSTLSNPTAKLATTRSCGPAASSSSSSIRSVSIVISPSRPADAREQLLPRRRPLGVVHVELERRLELLAHPRRKPPRREHRGRLAVSDTEDRPHRTFSARCTSAPGSLRRVVGGQHVARPVARLPAPARASRTRPSGTKRERSTSR